jgi:hypothetical protein
MTFWLCCPWAGDDIGWTRHGHGWPWAGLTSCALHGLETGNGVDFPWTGLAMGWAGRGLGLQSSGVAGAVGRELD